MATPKSGKTAPQPKAASKIQAPAKRAPTRAEAIMALMRTEGGVTAQALAEAVGWQMHSVRGFISGTLRKRDDIVVGTRRVDGVTHYELKDKTGARRNG